LRLEEEKGVVFLTPHPSHLTAACDAEGVQFLRSEDLYAVFAVKSGKYTFQVK
jgi:hypothetical protein